MPEMRIVEDSQLVLLPQQVNDIERRGFQFGGFQLAGLGNGSLPSI